MAKHTPTPWVTDLPDESDPLHLPIVSGGKSGEQTVCEILGPLFDEDGPHRGHYDMALILAAPELLAALKALLPELVRLARGSGSLDLAAAVGRAEEAIARAEGE